MVDVVKSGTLQRYSKSFMDGGWKKVHVVLHRDSLLVFHKKIGGDPNGSILLKNVAKYFACGKYTDGMEDRPEVSGIIRLECLLAIPEKPSRKSKIHWFAATSENELNEWMSAIVGTLPPMPNKSQSSGHAPPPPQPIMPQTVGHVGHGPPPPAGYPAAPPAYSSGPAGPPPAGFAAAGYPQGPPGYPQQPQPQPGYQQPYPAAPQPGYPPQPGYQQPYAPPPGGYPPQHPYQQHPPAAGYPQQPYQQQPPPPQGAYGYQQPGYQQPVQYQQQQPNVVYVQDNKHKSSGGILSSNTGKVAAGLAGGALLGYGASRMMGGGMYGGWGMGPRWGSWSSLSSCGSFGSFGSFGSCGSFGSF